MTGTVHTLRVPAHEVVLAHGHDRDSAFFVLLLAVSDPNGAIDPKNGDAAFPLDEADAVEKAAERAGFTVESETARVA